MDAITLPRSVVEQVLNWALNHGEKVYAAGGLKSIDSMNAWAEALRVALEQPDVRIPTSVPDGWKLVPVEPARDMLTTWIKAPVVSNTTAPGLYRAMLAAAPKPPVVEQPKVEQEPVAWAEEIIEYLHAHYDTEMIKELDSGDALIRLDDAIAAVEEVVQRYPYPQPPRQPLTREEIAFIAAACGGLASDFVVSVARAIEAAHGVKGRK